MAFPLIMEALARIEHKLDALMRWTGTPMPPPMHFTGSMCPSCGMLIDYQVDLQHGVVVRKCECKTGKVPSLIPLTPVVTPQGATNARADSAASPSEDGSQREVREAGTGRVRRP